MGVHSGIQHLLDIGGEGVGGHGDDWDGGKRCIGRASYFLVMKMIPEEERKIV